MALQKTTELDNGTSSNYWRVASISIEVSRGDIGDRGSIRGDIGDCGSIRVELYKDESARRAGKTPTNASNFTISPTDFMQSPLDNPYATAYALLKVRPEFADSTDV